MSDLGEQNGQPSRFNVTPVSSPFDQLTPIVRFDTSDLSQLSPLLNPSEQTDTSSCSFSKHRRRGSEIVLSPRKLEQASVSNDSGFSTSHWLTALFEWVHVTFAEKKHQELVIQEIIHRLNEMGVIPFNLSMSSEQLLEIQDFIDTLRQQIWQEHSKAINDSTLANALNSSKRGVNSILPYAAALGSSLLMKHSMTFSGSSLARAAFANRSLMLQNPPNIPLAALFPAGRYKNDFLERERLGHGGFGVVMKAVNRFDGTVYAVKKVIIKQKVINQGHLLQALREVRAASSLNHPNIVRYYAAWIESIENGSTHELDSSDYPTDDDSYFDGAVSPDIHLVPSVASFASDEFDIQKQLDKEFSLDQNLLKSDDGGSGIVFDEESKQSKGNSMFKIAESDDDDDDEDYVKAPSNNRLVPLAKRPQRLLDSKPNSHNALIPAISTTKVCFFHLFSF